MSDKKEFLKYFKMTMSYSNSKIWYLMLVALVPSVFIAFIFSPYGTIRFLCHYNDFYSAGFGEIYLIVSGINAEYYWLGIIGLVLVPLFFSVLFGAVERHMRVGEFSLGLSRVRSRLNYNFLTALKFSVMLFVIYQINKFLQVVMFYMFCRTMALGWALAASIVWYVIMFSATLFVFSTMILWVPTMLQTGLNSFKALGLSLRQGVRHCFDTMILQLIPIIPMLTFMVVNSLLDLKVDIVLDAILLTITSVYYVVLMYTVFFDINGIEREDLKKVDIWKKSAKDSARRK